MCTVPRRHTGIMETSLVFQVARRLTKPDVYRHQSFRSRRVLQRLILVATFLLEKLTQVYLTALIESLHALEICIDSRARPLNSHLYRRRAYMCESEAYDLSLLFSNCVRIRR